MRAGKSLQDEQVRVWQLPKVAALRDHHLAYQRPNRVPPTHEIGACPNRRAKAYDTVGSGCYPLLIHELTRCRIHGQIRTGRQELCIYHHLSCEVIICDMQGRGIRYIRKTHGHFRIQADQVLVAFPIACIEHAAHHIRHRAATAHVPDESTTRRFGVNPVVRGEGAIPAAI